jgi:serine/threonine protein kinase/tetratricopeptide (TPR) repeat protein
VTPERFRQIDQLVDLALEQKSSQRRAFLDKACAGDDELRRQVESLLVSDERLGGFLAATPAQVAADLFKSDCKDSVEEGGPSVSPPTALGRYEVSEEIGRGGMGVVYAAYDPELDRKVAIKLMRPETSESISASEGRARLMREAQAMARISHPNVIAVHDVGTIGEQVFIAMEYVEGCTLRQWLAERNQPWREVLGMFVQAGRGLAAAHAGGILHRDFKPENVLVSKEGRARVVDFGLARAAEQGKSEEQNAALAPADAKAPPRPAMLGVTVTQRGKFGTPAYMAPEQLMGERVDERTDQYSFCVALFQGLYGELPFNADDPGALLDQIEQRRVSDVPKLSPVPSRIHRALLRGLSPAPEDRYESMDQLLHELVRRPTAVWQAPLGALVVIAALLGIGRLAWQKSNTVKIRSIAVLPLENLSHEPQQEYIADGMTGELITNLSKVGSLRVIAPRSAMNYKSEPRSIRKIASELKVDAVLEGTVGQAGDRMGIAVRLINAGSEKNLWAGSYEDRVGNASALPNRTARAVIDAIRVKLTPPDERRLSGIRPINPEAYLAYLDGVSYFQKGFAKEDIYAAASLFERATALDPEFALAHARLAGATAYIHLIFDPSEEVATKAFLAVNTSLSLDPNLAEAYLARGMVAATALRLPHDAVIPSFKHALALNPNLPDAHLGLGSAYLHIGLLDQSLSQLNAALELDPLNYQSRFYLARVHLYQQRYEEALRVYERSPDFSPEQQWDKISILLHRGEKAAAHELARELQQRLPDNADIASSYAVVLATEGEKEKAEEQIRLAVRTGRGQHFHHAEYNIASAYALMGNHEQALHWLRRAAEHHLTPYPLFEHDSNLNNLRSNPDFKTWLGEMKSLWDRRRASL